MPESSSNNDTEKGGQRGRHFLCHYYCYYYYFNVYDTKKKFKIFLFFVVFKN